MTDDRIAYLRALYDSAKPDYPDLYECLDEIDRLREATSGKVGVEEYLAARSLNDTLRSVLDGYIERRKVERAKVLAVLRAVEFVDPGTAEGICHVCYRDPGTHHWDCRLAALIAKLDPTSKEP